MVLGTRRRSGCSPSSWSGCRCALRVAYAVWAGLGTAGIAVVGYLFLGESLGWVKAGAIGLIIAGVVVLNVTGSH